MKRALPNLRRTLPGGVAGVVWGLAGGLAGCANPGPPRPPSLHLPAVVRDLAAERVGNSVRLRWTTPRTTTEGDAAGPAITALVCREVSGGRTPGCRPLAARAVQPGASSFDDPLPPALSAAPDRLLLYRVELRNAQGRGAGPSASAAAAAGQAPAPAGTLAARPVRGGVELAWAAAGYPPASAAPMTVTRTGEPPPGKPRPAPPGPPHGPSRALPGIALPTLQGGGTESDTVRLEPEQAAADPDVGGVVDRSVEPGGSYTYTAQRVRRVALAGTRLELLGQPSPPVTVLFRDTFPPPVPAGLLAIPGREPLAIDLSWEPVNDPGLAGYTVYRAAEGTDFARLNLQPLPAPAFRDLHVRPGHTYRYRVTATDRRGNESAPGPEIAEPLEP